jgi:hypothetical protein
MPAAVAGLEVWDVWRALGFMGGFVAAVWRLGQGGSGLVGAPGLFAHRKARILRWLAAAVRALR